MFDFLFHTREVPFDVFKYYEVSSKEFETEFAPGTYIDLGSNTIYVPITESRLKLFNLPYPKE
jgi:hypothetical protein